VKPAAWPTQLPENGTVVTPTVDLGGGTNVTLPTIKVGEPIGTLPTPTKDGYAFAGWYVDGQKIDATWVVPSTPFTLVAKWTTSTNKTQTAASSIKAAKITAIKDQVYTGKVLAPAVKVTLSGKTLAANTDYTVKYAANTAIGKATVTVTGKSKYKDTVSATFKILPKAVSVKSLKAGKKKFTLKWKKAAGITKYQIRYKLSTKSAWKTVNVAASKTSKAVSKLKKGKKYQVQIRAYKTVSNINYYAAWSNVKAVKVK
jgi:uncharacterized repeat protein (TIGR02543 family)